MLRFVRQPGILVIWRAIFLFIFVIINQKYAGLVHELSTLLALLL